MLLLIHAEIKVNPYYWKGPLVSNDLLAANNYAQYIPKIIHIVYGWLCFVAVWCRSIFFPPLQWRRNGRDGVSNHQPHDCLLNRLFRQISKKISKLRVTGLCVGNSPVTGEFLAQRASNAENVSILWRHHTISVHFSVLSQVRGHSYDWPNTSITTLKSMEISNEMTLYELIIYGLQLKKQTKPSVCFIGNAI